MTPVLKAHLLDRPPMTSAQFRGSTFGGSRLVRIALVTLVALVAFAARMAAQQAPASAPAGVRRLSLDEALRLGEIQSEALDIARAGVGRAYGQRMQTRSQMLPQINGTAGYSCVDSFRTMEETIERIGHQLPDVLLSDISMPFESGYSLLEKIRSLAHEKASKIPAVALTAYTRPEDKQAAFEAGFQKHLGKPVETEDLIAAIIEAAGYKR